MCAVSMPRHSARGEEVTGEAVKRAIQRSSAYLRARQQADGHWPLYQMEGGTTALVLAALQNAGATKDDPAVRQGLKAVLAVPNRHTYVVALKIMAIALADPQAYAREIQRATEFLVNTQLANGAWTYGPGLLAGGDHSNTQFALLGLHEASRVGALVPQRVWQAADRHWFNTQLRDGGWGYSATGIGSATGSMTAAGVASMYIAGNNLVTRCEHGFNRDGKAPNCGQYIQNDAIAGGLAWLTRKFTVRSNPGHQGWHLYYLYAVERVGMLAGIPRFGRNDWYRQGAEFLVSTQRPDGSWGSSIPDTAFALLFLGKGHRSILVNKLRWGRGNDWQLDRNDAAHLTDWVGFKLDQPVTWQVVDVADPVERWLEAPILYFNGHRFAQLNQEDRQKMRRFVELGGTVLAEACCGSKAFADGMRALAADTFGEFPMHRLEADHPVYHSMYDLKAEDFELEGIDLGCRTSVIFSPKDLSCLWEQANIPTLSERAFRMGANIAAYATGREPLRDRLSIVQLPPEKRREEQVVRGGLQIGQVFHNGDWRPDPHALVNLARLLNERANVDVMTRPEPIRLEENTLFEHPIVYMVGHFDFTLTQAQSENLKRFLTRGGFLFGEACCGRKAFDTAFRRMVARMFGPDALKPLPGDHPILSGSIGYDISRVTYRSEVQREQPDLNKPVLEGVTLEGRTALVYSPYGIGCGLEGHKCYRCLGYEPRDAEHVAINIVLYALSY
jgi:hypothetical protein